MRFFEDISRFYGTGEKNKDGHTLDEFLENYDARKFDCPSNTTDIIVVRCQEELNHWGQELEFWLIKRGNHPGIGFWATPGGFVDMKENLYEGAARELEEEQGVKVGAKVSVTYNVHKILEQKHYKILESNGLAADHGCLITQALLYMKEKLER